MKFKAVDEIHQFSFEDSEIQELKIEGEKVEFTFNGATVKAGNSQNGRYQNMYCGTIILQLENATIARIVKEGMKYYDANGALLSEVPDEDVPAPAKGNVLERCKKGTVFTAVEDKVAEGYAYEFGIDVPGEEDEEEVDTFWLCIVFEHSVAMWDKYVSPTEGEN
ncbi:MAG: hypothetical protein J1F22_07435 [Lachnospiraceae bacterium]|nr:hypothetical protein [Lachnospiraceae bacterium]